MIPALGRLGEAVERWGPRAAVGVAAGIAALAGSYAAVGYTPRFVLAPVATFVTVIMPGPVVTFAITVLGDLGDQLALATAAGLSVGLLGTAALAGDALARRADVPRLAGPFAALGTLAVAAPVTGSILSGVFAAVGAGAVVGIAGLAPDPDAGFAGRRAVLAGGATALGAGLLGVAFGRDHGITMQGGAVPAGEADELQRDMLSAAGALALDLDGTEPLVSEDFYGVDINQVDPTVDADDWTLDVTGEVGQSVTYDYGDVTGRPAEHRFVTLRCVGEALNGQKMDTALWTGVPVADLVEPADPDGDRVFVRAADGYYQEFPAAALEDALLAFEMNGEPLPRAHGYPARVLVPGHWGEINVKWITEIEFRDEETDGYWEERGWHGTGPVETVAKLWTVDRLDDGRIQVGGHAYAGTRGIERVEVSTDGGETWTDAELSEPLPGRVVEAADGSGLAGGTDDDATRPDAGDGPVDLPDTDDEVATPSAAVAGPDVADDAWRQWVHRYDPPDGSHEVVVRAVDGTGERQAREQRDAFPSGATGWVSETVDP